VGEAGKVKPLNRPGGDNRPPFEENSELRLFGGTFAT
jgi:hypothetical protein